jgi:hypothetical protein
MNWSIDRSDTAIEGSIQDIANKTGQTIESVFAACKAVVLLDVSGSMRENDVHAGNEADGNNRMKSRIEAAGDALKEIQKLYKGYIAVVCFSDNVKLCPSGMPIFEGGGTKLHAAMEYVLPLDGSGMKFIIVTDGHPDAPSACLELKEKFTQPFEIIGIGNGANKEFLEKLGNFTSIATEALSLEGLSQKLLHAAVEE